LNSGIESDSAGHSTIFASLPRHSAPNTADPAAVIRSTVCTGGINGAIGGCGINKGGIVGGMEAVGRLRMFAGMSGSFLALTGGDLNPAGGQDAMDKTVAPADAAARLCARDGDGERRTGD